MSEWIIYYCSSPKRCILKLKTILYYECKKRIEIPYHENIKYCDFKMLEERCCFLNLWRVFSLNCLVSLSHKIQKKKSENVASQEACFNEWKLNVNKLLLMMVLENHFLSRSIHTAALSEAEQKQAVKMNFHILKDLIYMPAFLAQPNFFPLRL